VAHDAGIAHQALRVARAEARDLPGIEARKRAPVAFALVENRRPGEARLRALEDQELEELPVVAHRHAPFLVVIAPVELAPQAPGAAALVDLPAHRRMVPPGTPVLPRRRERTSASSSRSRAAVLEGRAASASVRAGTRVENGRAIRLGLSRMPGLRSSAGKNGA